jgi:NAD(P)-dependent dehydrogenase (short-subunit alcohol dehydrogenase family)
MRRAFIVTGASRGFGRAIASSVAKSLVKSSHFVLAGTSEEELRKTEEIVKSTPRDGVEATTELVLEDLSQTSHLSDAASKLFDSIAASSDIDDIVFFNNAGSLGPLAPVGAEVHTLSSVATAFDINVTASCFLTSEIIRR